jgi:hypothetical protein
MVFMRNQRVVRTLLATIATLAAIAPTALAGESVRAAVSIPAGQPEPLITANGNPYAQGNYAVGTLRLEYTYVGFVFQPGPFGSFDLGLDTVQGNGGATVYPASLNLVQSGSTNLVLTASPTSFTVSPSPWAATSIVSISIPQSVANDPTLAVDGAVIVGNLQMTTGPGSKLGTTTSVQVKIRLVHPTACIKQYTFFSTREISGDYGTLSLSYGTRGGNLNKILNMSPVSANAAAQVVLLVNTCGEAHTVDLRIAPDARFVFGSGNGNTTFVYTGAGELSPGAIDLAALTVLNSLSHTLDVTSLSIGAGQSILVKVHLVLNGTLTALNVGNSPFTFASSAFEPGGTFSTLDSEADPNPATKNVTFSLVPQN